MSIINLSHSQNLMENAAVVLSMWIKCCQDAYSNQTYRICICQLFYSRLRHQSVDMIRTAKYSMCAPYD